MAQYRRYRISGGCYFFTVNLADRRWSLLTDHIEALRNALRQVKTAHPFKIEAMAVLPNHLHCIWTLPSGDDDFSTRWRQIKSAFSRDLPTTEHRSSSRIVKGERGIWQRRFWEHALRDERDIERHVDYIHYNPVKHEYAAQAWDWPYSSFRRFVAQGIYPRDWGGEGVSHLDLG